MSFYVPCTAFFTNGCTLYRKNVHNLYLLTSHSIKRRLKKNGNSPFKFETIVVNVMSNSLAGKVSKPER